MFPIAHDWQVVASDHTRMRIRRKVKVLATVRSHLGCDLPQTGESQEMATQLCQKCKQSHPGRVCDYDEKGDCAETITVNEVAQPCKEPPKEEED